MHEKLKEAIVTELERQAQEHRGDAPWIDAKLITGHVIIDGLVNLDDLIEAISKALAPTE